jgi:hypothetical protein
VSRLEVLFRVVLNAGIAASIALAASVWIATPLFLVGIAVTGELAVRPYARNGIERALLACGATVTASILIGLCLNLTPWGLTRWTWLFSWLVVSTAVLIWRRASRTPFDAVRIRSYCLRHWLAGLYGLAAVVIFVVAGTVAISGVRIWSQKPMLAFSLVSKSSSAVVVNIDAISTNATYRIVAESGTRKAHHYLSAPILVNAGGKGQSFDESVPVNVPGRWTIDLNAVNGSTGVRELIVNVGR